MAFDSRQLQHEDRRLAELQRGSVAMVVGWIILGMAALCGLLFFQTFRDGTLLWRNMTLVMGAIGFVLVLWGNYRRKASS
ncbi:MAG TPA: hypothetical protein VF786_04195 [Terriglobales bacterium]